MAEPKESHNKGTGAGGSNTNHNGIAFENKTDNEIRLIADGYVRKNITGKEKTKYGYYLEKIGDNNTTHFLKQNGLIHYMSVFHQKELFREVDEAYVIIDNITHDITVKILEKKNQTGNGSVEDKLCLGHYFKFVEYPISSTIILDDSPNNKFMSLIKTEFINFSKIISKSTKMLYY